VVHPEGEQNSGWRSLSGRAKFTTLQPRKLVVEFHPSHQARGHGGQLAVAAWLEEFGLAERIEREPALAPRTHRGKGCTPLLYVTQRLDCFTSGGVSLADAELLNQDEPFKVLLAVEKLPDETSIGEPGWQALRRLSRDFVQWALARAEPDRWKPRRPSYPQALGRKPKPPSGGTVQTGQYGWFGYQPSGCRGPQRFAVVRHRAAGEMVWRYAFAPKHEQEGPARRV